MVSNENDFGSLAWEDFWRKLEAVKRNITACKTTRISSGLRNQVKTITQVYFRTLRPSLMTLGLETSELDEAIQSLLSLSSRRSYKKNYLEYFSGIKGLKDALEINREVLISNILSKESKINLSPIELKILETLKEIDATLASSYGQVIKDINDPERISFRGTATELREILREVLDNLAPDADVMSPAGFKLEKERTTPTMQQKVRFILKSRGLTKGAIEVPENSVNLIDEKSSLVRSAYTRGAISTHRATDRPEVKQLKMYVDGVLAELLEINKSD